jgi:hypothetical protein
VKRKEVIEMVEHHGLAVVSIVRNSHWKVRVRRRDGTERYVIFSCTSSEYRAMKNKAAQLRNIATGAE